ncbi:MAG: energy transducer TonB [Lacunisphaera sp.]
MIILLVLGALVANGRGTEPAPAPQTEGDTVQLPNMQVFGGYSLKDFPFPKKSEVKAPDFPTSDPNLRVQYPGHAFYEGVSTGTATVGVMLDRRGKPVDFLLIRYTKDYFGKALLQEARRREFTPRYVRDVAIPGPFIFTYLFEPPAGLTNISSFEAASHRTEQVQGGPKFIYEPHRENTLDTGQLESTQVAIPMLPAGYLVPDGKPLRALVTFFVDEQGKVRLPNIESTLAPELIPAALQALQQWTFKPPTIRGKPVLVHAMRALSFRPAPPAAPAR